MGEGWDGGLMLKGEGWEGGLMLKGEGWDGGLMLKGEGWEGGLKQMRTLPKKAIIIYDLSMKIMNKTIIS